MNSELALLALFIAVILVITASIYSAGGTFGYRCEKLYPTDVLKYNMCVHSCSKGEIKC